MHCDKNAMFTSVNRKVIDTLRSAYLVVGFLARFCQKVTGGFGWKFTRKVRLGPNYSWL